MYEKNKNTLFSILGWSSIIMPGGLFVAVICLVFTICKTNVEGVNKEFFLLFLGIFFIIALVIILLFYNFFVKEIISYKKLELKKDMLEKTNS